MEFGLVRFWVHVIPLGASTDCYQVLKLVVFAGVTFTQLWIIRLTDWMAYNNLWSERMLENSGHCSVEKHIITDILLRI